MYVYQCMCAGQMKLGQKGNQCLSQKGSAAGIEDVAARGAIVASSAADVAAHGANMAVDGGSNTFWVHCSARIDFATTCVESFASFLFALQASEMDPAGPVELVLDIGSPRKVSAINLDWEFPAKAFALSVSADGVKWSEVHSTDSNILDSSHISLGLVSATKVKVVMHQVCDIVLLQQTRWRALRECMLSGSKPFPWAPTLWHQEARGARAPFAKRGRGLRFRRQKQRRSRQVFRNICG